MTGSDDPLPVILVVDDDTAARAALLEAVDRRYGHDYDVDRRRLGRRRRRIRLQDLHDEGRPVAMIVADHHMPGETGARLLAASRRLHPTAQRLLLTDWADFSTIDDTVQALTVGEIDTWVARPFGPADEEFHTVLTAALARWTHEADRAGVALTIVGEPWDASTGVLRDAFARLLLPFRFRDAASAEGRALLEAAGVEGPLPVVILADGRALLQPSQADVAMALGVQGSIGEERVDVAVIGAGPAGLAAAVYAASEGLSVTVIESTAIGGQASSSPMMRNYLGFPAGVTGAELTARAYQQAVTFGVKFVFGRTAAALRVDGEDRIVTLDDGAELRAEDVIVATGVSYRRMGIERLEALVGRGVYYGSGTSEARALERRARLRRRRRELRGVGVDPPGEACGSGDAPGPRRDARRHDVGLPDPRDRQRGQRRRAPAHRDRGCPRRAPPRRSGPARSFDREFGGGPGRCRIHPHRGGPAHVVAAAGDPPRRPRIHPDRRAAAGRQRRAGPRDDDAGRVRRRRRAVESGETRRGGRR